MTSLLDLQIHFDPLPGRLVLEQVAVEAEVRAEHLGDAEGEMAVRDGNARRRVLRAGARPVRGPARHRHGHPHLRRVPGLSHHLHALVADGLFARSGLFYVLPATDRLCRILNLNDQAFSQNLKRLFNLIQARLVAEIEQAIHLRQMPAQTPCQFSVFDSGFPHLLIE